MLLEQQNKKISMPMESSANLLDPESDIDVPTLSIPKTAKEYI